MAQLTAARLRNQQIGDSKFSSAVELVRWMGAMQAQDFPMSKWAVGARLPGATEQNIEAAIDSGEILRTHLLRPTWHLVAAADIRWMLRLTAPHIRASMRSRQKQLEITDAVLTQTYTILDDLMSGGRHATREEIVTELVKAKIGTADNRVAHLLMCAELDERICSGAAKGNKPTYALLRDRAPETPLLSREDALHTLAARYFNSHGPATVQDFTWWSGLPVGDARKALEMIRPGLLSETDGANTYWFADTPGYTDSHPTHDPKGVFLLPAFDEYLISYKDRSAALPLQHTPKAISINGIFWPVIVVDGRVEGLWKRAVKKDTVTISPDFFHPPGAAVKKSVQEAAESFGRFLQKKTVVL